MTNYARTCAVCGKSYRITEFPFIGRGGNRKPDAPRNTVCKSCLRVQHQRRRRNRETAARIVEQEGCGLPSENFRKPCDHHPPSADEIRAAEFLGDRLQGRLPTLAELKANRNGHPSDAAWLVAMTELAGPLPGY
jgi:hypothetical protein